MYEQKTGIMDDKEGMKNIRLRGMIWAAHMPAIREIPEHGRQ